MTPETPIWVRVGGGLESVPGHYRHGPADVDWPPPEGPWEALTISGKLVGWAERGGASMARRCAELGQQLANEHRDHLLGRLGHKLRSSVLALQESARQAAFGRAELLEGLYEQALDVAHRAAALECAAMQPKDGARRVVLGAVMNLALPSAVLDMPPDAVVLGAEPVLVEAFTRARDWLGDPLKVSAQPVGSWWRIHVESTGERKPLAVAEMGEPLLRLIVDTQLQGWLDVSSRSGADIYLPAYPTQH